MNLKEQLTGLQTSMRAIVDDAKAANRDLTDTEMGTLEAKSTEAVALKGRIERAEKSAALMDRIGGMRNGTEHLGTGAVTGEKPWGVKATDALATLAARTPGGVKSLVSGSVDVPALLSPTLIDAHPRSILDLIPRGGSGSGVRLNDAEDEPSFVGRSGGVGNGFSYLRQLLRTNNAAAVPDLAEKPTSEYTFDQVDDTFRVYATKTEDLPWRYLADFGDLTDILSVQLRDDVLAAIEGDVVSGDGEDDRFTGILATSGIQQQVFTTDLLTTLSAARWKLLAQDRQLTGWALNPLDLQALELLRENGDTGQFLFKSHAEIEGRLGAPVVTSLRLPVGTAVAADWTQAELLPLGDDELVFDGKNRTENNTFRIMYEGRYGFRVKKPFDFVKVQLTA